MFLIYFGWESQLYDVEHGVGKKQDYKTTDRMAFVFSRYKTRGLRLKRLFSLICRKTGVRYKPVYYNSLPAITIYTQ